MVPIIIVAGGVLLLLILVIVFKLSAFFSLIITSLAVGVMLGMPAADVVVSIEQGMGSTLGSLTMILGFGVMLGKLIADGGGVQRISTRLIEARSEENTSELQSLMRNSYAVFRLKKKN